MTTNGLPVFDDTVQKTNIWLKELMERLSIDSRHDAYRALSVTLHALRDRLPVNTAVALSAQMPMLIRGFYYEGWKPSKCPTKDRTENEFVDGLAAAFDFTEEDYEPKRIASAVFAVLMDKLSPGEVEHVQSCLPYHIRNLWPATPD